MILWYVATRIVQRLSDLPEDVVQDLMEYLDLDPNDQPATRRFVAGFICRTKGRYGLKAVDFVRLYRHEGRRCPICGKKPAKGKQLRRTRTDFVIDHSQDRPREIRGLICRECNKIVDYYDKYRTTFNRYIKRAPAKELGLNLPVREFRHSPVEPLTINTITRCQDLLDRGRSLKEISRAENIQHATLTREIKQDHLRIPKSRCVVMRAQMGNGSSWEHISRDVGVPPRLLKWLVESGRIGATLQSP